MTSKWKQLLDKAKLTEQEVFARNKKLFYSDLHAMPYKNVFLNESFNVKTILKSSKTYKVDFTDTIWHQFDLVKRRLFLKKIVAEDSIREVSLPRPLFFYTRPFSALELCFLFPAWSSTNRDFRHFKSLISLFRIKFPSASLNVSENEFKPLIKVSVEHDDLNLDRKFALTSLQTDDTSWKAVVKDKAFEPDKSRSNRLFDLLTSILKCKNKVDYVVFPELSIPRNLLTYIASKLKTKGISLVAGVEYKNENVPDDYPKSIKGIVSNQLVYILNVKRDKLSDQICIIQEKVYPALQEEKDLYDEAGKILEAKNESKYLVEHGGLFLSGLICNDLLNIDYRQSLRGKIDALIVVEWNKDVETYDALVSSTANDLHCFVLQVNNRKYGDTRLRAPYKEKHERDKVRVRGGEIDYFVLATLEVNKLREFQDRHISNPAPFKPTPTGYSMIEERKKYMNVEEKK